MAWQDTLAGKAYGRAYREANRERLRAQNRAIYYRNPERIKQNTKARKERDPLAFLIQQARRRAKKNEIPFTITVKDFDGMPLECPVLGITLNPFAGKQHPSLPSLDRIVPELGYIPGNVCIISWRANLLKRDVTDPEELRRVANYLDVFFA